MEDGCKFVEVGTDTYEVIPLNTYPPFRLPLPVRIAPFIVPLFAYCDTSCVMTSCRDTWSKYTELNIDDSCHNLSCIDQSAAGVMIPVSSCRWLVIVFVFHILPLPIYVYIAASPGLVA